ncbi:hypothetical protein F2Q68_00008613 [Brassica cretica]|uniref:Uncharacterized protein n=1 Tax=Brassica cretica TaxID=69181 RepID=A0A8S9KVA9_BRACR|nr:hypothetical protein F2Q68_00008613 [Brassica cretica]
MALLIRRNSRMTLTSSSDGPLVCLSIVFLPFSGGPQTSRSSRAKVPPPAPAPIRCVSGFSIPVRSSGNQSRLVTSLLVFSAPETANTAMTDVFRIFHGVRDISYGMFSIPSLLFKYCHMREMTFYQLMFGGI